jgi:hypothetical protein
MLKMNFNQTSDLSSLLHSHDGQIHLDVLNEFKQNS